MTNVGFLDVCRFTATSSGTGDFVVNTAVIGYQTPTSAGAVNGKVYRYRAESSDLTEWEVGYGAYTSGTTTLARTTILFSSTGAKVNFTAAPQVAIVFLAEDFNGTGQIPGTSTNDAATSGNIGELISSTVSSGSAVALSGAGTVVNVTSISLSAGDWDITGAVVFNPGATTNITLIFGSISATSTVHDTTPGQFFIGRFGSSGLVPGNPIGGDTIGPLRVSLSGTTTYYLTASSAFTVSTNAAYGTIRARRVR